jgi:hypothetical protein
LFKNSNSGDLDSFGHFENGKLVVSGAQNNFKKLIEIMDLGLSPIALTNLSDEFNPKILINELLDYTDDINVVNNLVKRLTTDHMNQLPQIQKDILLEKLIEKENKEYVVHLFEIGYKIEQGSKESALECDLARNGRLEIFEIIKLYQPDFNYNNTYIDIDGKSISLMQLIKEELPFENRKIYHLMIMK